MDWVPTALMLMAITLLTVQGVVLLSQDRRKLATAYPNKPHLHILFAGGVNIILALFALSAYFLFASGALILSPEFGVLLAQGRLAWLWAMAVVFGITVGIAGLLHVIRSANFIPSSKAGLLAGGCIASFVAVLRAQVLNPDEPAAFRIRCLDLWNFFFLAWIVSALTLWVLIVIHQNRAAISWRRRLLGVVFMLTLCGLAATYHATVGLVSADPWNLYLWRVTVWLGVPIFMCTLTWCSCRLRQSKHRASVSFLASALAATAGIFSAHRWTQYVDGWRSWTAIRAALVVCFIIWVVWALFLGLRRGGEWFRCAAQHERAAHGTATFLSILRRVPAELRRSLQRLPDIGNPGRRDDVIALICFAIMVGSIVDMSHSARLDPIWDLTALIISWLVLSEIIAVYPLCHASKELLNTIKTDGAIFTKSEKKLKDGLGRLLTPVRWLFSAEKWTGAVLKIAIVVVIIIAVAELPNAGKTVVLSFSSTDLGVEEQGKDKSSTDSQNLSKELGRLVSERVVNTIGVVGKDIRPSLMVADTKGNVAWIPASSDTTGNVQAAFANSSIQIPGTQTTLPLSGVVLYVQELSRWVLGVRQISGSVQKEGGRYVLLASSSTGESWRVTETPSRAGDVNVTSPEATAKKAKTEPGKKNAPDHKAAKSPPLPPADRNSPKQRQRLRLTSSRPTSPPSKSLPTNWRTTSLPRTEDCKVLALHRSLMRSPHSARGYRSGIVSKSAEIQNSSPNPSATSMRLSDKIQSLPWHTIDSGQAYLSDGQPRAAADAFRESVRSNPKFVAGYIALAETLYVFDEYYYPMPAAVAPSDRVNNYGEVPRQRDQAEARQKLQTVISDLGPNLTATWRAAAYFGLCRDAYERDKLSANQPVRYIAFFYCRRAEYLYARLPANLRSDPTYKSKEIMLLAGLANVLNPYQDFVE